MAPSAGFSSPSRVLRLAGADNARDLGGLPTVNGGTVRFGRLFRGELLSRLSGPDVEILVKRVGLRTVVDLRSRDEVRYEVGSWFEHEVAWVNCPFKLGAFGPVPGPGADYVAGYLAFLDGRPAAVVHAVRTLIDPAHQPAIFHCAAGKDRTGILAALLLDVLGVHREAIAEDYAQSGEGLARVFERLGAIEPYGALRSVDPCDHRPVAATISEFLDAVDCNHGGAVRWLTDHGLDARAIARFRTAMVTRR
jgi:hypothetical protein